MRRDRLDRLEHLRALFFGRRDALDLCADPDGDPTTDDMIHVVNMSLGGPGHADDALSLAIDAASEAGMIVVAAAGNSGVADMGSPASARSAITVAAIDSEGTSAGFSTRGPGAPYVSKPDLGAPGVLITSTVQSEASALNDLSRASILCTTRSSSVATMPGASCFSTAAYRVSLS